MKTSVLAVSAAILISPGVANAGTGVITGNADNWSFTENWSDYATGATCQYDTFPLGIWIAQFDGGGCTSVPALTPHRLRLSPAVSTSSGTTHAALVTSSLVQGDPSKGADIYLDFVYKTTAQLRQNNTPNAWEVGWLTWNGKYDSGCSCFTFNYLILKPNNAGYELGKVVNNGGTQGQVFLATGAGNFPINTQYNVEVYHSNATHNGYGDQVDIYVNSSLLVSYTGANGQPFRSGWAAGMYTEDATVEWTKVSGTRL